MEKRLQRALCKQLSLPQHSDENTLLEALEQMLKKQKELVSTLQAERSRSAADTGCRLGRCVFRGGHGSLRADRALGNEMFEAVLAQHAQAQQQVAAQQKTLQAVVAGS